MKNQNIMKALFCSSLTIQDENDIPDNIIRSTGLHVKCTTKILSHVPIEGVILHLDESINPTYFISLLACSWLKKIKYLRIWQSGKPICIIYSDKINIKVNCFSYLNKDKFILKYHNKLSDGAKLIFTPPPLEIRTFFSSGLKPNRLLLASPSYLRSISQWDSICYRNCIITVMWLLYFVASNSRRKVTDEGNTLYKHNNAWSTMTDILKEIYMNINNGIDLRYLSNEEIIYVDDIYLECISIEVLTLGRICKAHP